MGNVSSRHVQDSGLRATVRPLLLLASFLIGRRDLLQSVIDWPDLLQSFERGPFRPLGFSAQESIDLVLRLGSQACSRRRFPIRIPCLGRGLVAEPFDAKAP